LQQPQITCGPLQKCPWEILETAPESPVAYDANPVTLAAIAMPNLDFTLTGDYVELHNLLKITGLADSGGSAKMMVAEGAVTVDGRVELRKTCKIRAGQVVLLGDTRIAVHEA
jgi:ribosome-associated protein